MDGCTFLLDAEKPSAKETWTQVARLGSFYDKRYGTFSITPEHVASWSATLTAHQNGEAPVDYDHSPEKGKGTRAAAWIRDLKLDGERVLAKIAWTDAGAKAVRGGEYRYLSPTFTDSYKDEQGNPVGKALLGAALTNRPFLRQGMAAVNLSMSEAVDFVLDYNPNQPRGPDGRWKKIGSILREAARTFSDLGDERAANRLHMQADKIEADDVSDGDRLGAALRAHIEINKVESREGKHRAGEGPFGKKLVDAAVNLDPSGKPTADALGDLSDAGSPAEAHRRIVEHVQRGGTLDHLDDGMLDSIYGDAKIDEADSRQRRADAQSIMQAVDEASARLAGGGSGTPSPGDLGDLSDAKSPAEAHSRIVEHISGGGTLDHLGDGMLDSIYGDAQIDEAESRQKNAEARSIMKAVNEASARKSGASSGSSGKDIDELFARLGDEPPRADDMDAIHRHISSGGDLAGLSDTQLSNVQEEANTNAYWARGEGAEDRAKAAKETMEAVAKEFRKRGKDYWILSTADSRDVKAIALALGLDPSANEAAVRSKVATLQAAADQGAAAAADLRAMKFATAFREAVKAGRIAPAQEETLKALYEVAPDNTLKLMADSPAVVPTSARGENDHESVPTTLDADFKREGDLKSLDVDHERAELLAKAEKIAADRNITLSEALEELI